MKKYFDSYKEKVEFLERNKRIVVVDYGIKTIMGEKKYWIEYKNGGVK